MMIRESGRSSDYISPSFGHGCLYSCVYCYMRRNKQEGLTVATNIGDILTAINDHVTWLPKKESNQTHDKYWTYDISCNEDFALHANKYYNWKYIFDFFKDHPTAFGTFATKYVPKYMLEYNPEQKIRIRFSLMPEPLRQVLEPNTATIGERIGAINSFIEAGYDVHVNFSPVVYFKNWLDEYKMLFRLLDSLVKKEHKNKVKAEVIFLTHNDKLHGYNIENKIPSEILLWNPKIQETKISSYGGNNVRYKHQLKKQFINEFITLHDEIISWNKIRYIF